MKLVRPIVIAVLLVGAFFYLTTYRSGKFRLGMMEGLDIGNAEHRAE